MKYRIAAGAFAATALLISGVLAQDALKSGPQVGDSKSITPFNPKHSTGPNVGTKLCLV
jgi:hypothetical protein